MSQGTVNLINPVGEIVKSERYESSTEYNKVLKRWKINYGKKFKESTVQNLKDKVIKVEKVRPSGAIGRGGVNRISKAKSSGYTSSNMNYGSR